MEVKCLHGFRTLLWTSNARRALEREHNKLCATVVAGEIVNDILLNMLEGWYFGERESNFTVAGFVDWSAHLRGDLATGYLTLPRGASLTFAPSALARLARIAWGRCGGTA